MLLLATLIIGLVLGALINGYFVRQRLARIGDFMNPAGFGGRIEEVVQPTSDEQRAAIRSVLDGAAPMAVEIMRESRSRMRALNDSVRSELSGILTSEQMERLDERMRLRRRRGPFRPGLPPMMLDDSTGRRPRWEHRRRRPGGGPPPPADSMGAQLPPPPPPGI
jgi:hypothetical protein